MTTGAEVMQQLVPASPFVRRLGMRLGGSATARPRSISRYRGTGHVQRRRPAGAPITTLIDVTAMATSSAGAPVPESLRGATVSLSVDYVDGAVKDLVASGTPRPARRLGCCFCDIDVTTAGRPSRRQGHRHLQGRLTRPLRAR